MPSSPSNGSWRMLALAWAAALGALLLAGGCIADTAEDSDLPWSRDQGWEGQIPIPGNAAGRYD